MKKIFIKEDNGKEKEIGCIHGETFYKIVKKSKHFFRKAYAWGIDADVYQRIILPQTKTIKILDKENKKVYETSTGNFNMYGRYLQYFPHRKQLLLNINYFLISDYKK